MEKHTTPNRLLLDGQQRLTSLYQSLYSDQPVDTTDARGKRLRRWYYLDMAAVLRGDDPEEAVLSVPEDRQRRDNFGREVVADYSSMELECVADVFPLSRVFRPDATNHWMVSYLQLVPEDMPKRLDRWNAFQERALANFTSYLVPVIVLTKTTPKEAVCTVFEKVNTGGVPLNVFELLTATFAAEGYRLNDDWRTRRERLAQRPALTSVESTDFLQIVTTAGLAGQEGGACGAP